MIVEDENGNDIDLHDLRDTEREPEPPEEEHLTLDEIGQALDAYRAGHGQGEHGDTLALLLEQALPQLLNQAHANEVELEEWRSMTLTESRYAMTGTDQPPTQGLVVELLTVPEANTAAERHESGLGAPVWVMHTYATTWLSYPSIPF